MFIMSPKDNRFPPTQPSASNFSASFKPMKICVPSSRPHRIERHAASLWIVSPVGCSWHCRLFHTTTIPTHSIIVVWLVQTPNCRRRAATAPPSKVCAAHSKIMKLAPMERDEDPSSVHTRWKSWGPQRSDERLR